MKRIYLISLLLIFAWSGCKKEIEIITGYFDSIHFVREGGGQIDFIISPSDNLFELSVLVTKYNYLDTSIQLKLDILDLGQAYSYYNQVLNSQIQINGDFKQPTTKTGTWIYVYAVDGDKEIEVTNTDLRSILLTLEQKVRDKIQ
jgi:hypothetical protein